MVPRLNRPSPATVCCTVFNCGFVFTKLLILAVDPPQKLPDLLFKYFDAAFKYVPVHPLYNSAGMLGHAEYTRILQSNKSLALTCSPEVALALPLMPRDMGEISQLCLRALEKNPGQNS